MIATIVLLALAVVVHPALAGLALALAPFIAIHVVLVRHSRSRVRIPDHRIDASDPELPTT